MEYLAISVSVGVRERKIATEIVQSAAKKTEKVKNFEDFLFDLLEPPRTESPEANVRIAVSVSKIVINCT